MIATTKCWTVYISRNFDRDTKRLEKLPVFCVEGTVKVSASK